MYPTKDRLELLEHTIRNSKASHFKLDIYCKTILMIESKSNKFGTWPPN
jgi:hypothetical protein